jgi:DNA-binding MarR family transcriptional regulator
LEAWCNNGEIAAQLRRLADKLSQDTPFSSGELELPPERAACQLIHERRLRDQYFDPALFGEPAWDMLLDLYAARERGKRISVSSLCIAAAVPPTTALRWITLLESAGMIVRLNDLNDRRRVFVTLSNETSRAVRGYLGAISGSPPEWSRRIIVTNASDTGDYHG